MSFSSIRLTASQIFDHFGLYRLHCSVNLSGVYPVFVPGADTDLEARISVCL